MSQKITSVHKMFEGEVFDNPKHALVVRTTTEGEPIYSCPHCHHETDINACDVLGAEWNCVFCPQCSGEFHL